jgi:ATP-dependent Clp protease adaptor protein ClpS
MLQAVTGPHDPNTVEADPDFLTETRLQKPSLYKVLLLNDDYTPMEFVVHILQHLFGKSMEDATAIMLQIHHTGSGLCGIYTLEVAETKVMQVMALGRRHQHPLQCTLEKD